jgi:hypothetical protein
MNKNNFIFRSETSDKNESNNILSAFIFNNNNKNIIQDSDNISNNSEYDTDIYNDYSGTSKDIIYEDFYDEVSIKENNDYDTYLYDKYFNLQKKQEKILEIRYSNETSELNELYQLVYKNNYTDIEKYFKSGNTIFRNKQNENGNGIIIKSLCTKNNCQNFKKYSFNSMYLCKQCEKTPVYYSLRNTNRGIKTTYNYLLRLLIVEKKFRIFCECCKNKTMCVYLEKMNECYKNKKDISEIATLLNPKKKMELEINFYINKFMKVISFLKCECKFNNYDKSYYSENFYNFLTVYEIYLTTIPNLIKLLKKYYSLNENNEELYLINDSRCIHEDIQYYNLLTYCERKKNDDIDFTKQQIELIMKIENANKWISNSLKINILMINEQSLELFNYELLGKEVGNSDYQKIFEKLYNIKNIFINLDYKICNENIINTILKSKFQKNKSVLIVKSFIKQYLIRNNTNEKLKKNFEENMINYAKDCIENNDYLLGMEFLKDVKKSSNIPKTHQMHIILKCIFDKIINTELLTNDEKISFLKIINKNKINVSEYDFVNNLINCENGDNIILGFDKDSNNLFKINNYESDIYIKETIKNCIINFKPNIIDYILHNLKDKIEFFNINPINIYLTNIKKINTFTKKIENEIEYIHILEIILKYEKLANIDKKNNLKYYEPIQYCINNNLTYSAKLFIKNKFINDDDKLILECISKNNHIIAEYLIQNNPELIRVKHDKLNLLNIIIKKNDNNYLDGEQIQVRFIKKIVEPIVTFKINECNLINEDDEYNESLGFLLLSSNKISNKNKIFLINYIKNHIDSMKINKYYDKEIFNKNTKNIPLIIYSYLLDEYEITFILLNSLIKDDRIDKIKKNNNSIFNNYCKNDDININIIPIIIKYLKDNHEYYSDFDENNINNIILDTDKETMIILLMCMQIICGYIRIIMKYNKIKNNKTEINIIERKKINNIVDNNKYKEISINGNSNKSALFETDNENNLPNNINNFLLNNYNDIKKSKNKKINKFDDILSDSSNNSTNSSDSLIIKNDILM